MCKKIEPEETPNNMLQETHSLLLDQLGDHVAEYRPNRVEALVGMTNISKPSIIEKYLLYDEYCNGLAQLRTSFHDPQAQGNDFRRQQEIDNLSGVILDQGANDTQRSQAEILEWS